MTQAQSSEEKAQLKVQWTRLAIDQALANQWEEAVSTNRNILNFFPTEPEAFNRLGKALSELGRYSEARQAYTQTLKYSPNNTIAKKNLDRLSLLQEEPILTHAGVERIDPRLFIEETGKTGMTDLINIAPASVLAKVGVGDKVQLHVNGHTIFARNSAGEDIGQIEPRLLYGGWQSLRRRHSGDGARTGTPDHSRRLSASRYVWQGQLPIAGRRRYYQGLHQGYDGTL